jgi:very-short-patch-repair endonuclease
VSAIVEDRPLDEEDDFAALRRAQQEVVSRRQALLFLTASQVRHRLDSGRWRALQRGVYLTRQGPVGEAQREWVALLAAGYDRDQRVCLGGLSALRVWGLRRVDPDAIHILTPAGRRQIIAPRGAVIHRTRRPPEREETRLAQPPATLAGRAVVDAAQWARSDQEARLIIVASFQQRLVSLGEIERACAPRCIITRRELILATARDGAAGSHSLGELFLVDLCRRAGLPVPSRQVRRRDRAGRIRYLDALFDPWRVAVEIDGVHHLEAGQSWDDAKRRNSLVLDGYVVLRYPAHVVREFPDRVAAEIRQALLRAGWRP